jgi:hypothetical protein
MSENREEILADFQVIVKSTQYVVSMVDLVCDGVGCRKVCYSGCEEFRPIIG